jgi:GTP cyclohydrolase IB
MTDAALVNHSGHLPDVATNEPASWAGVLDWVGMSHIDLPIIVGDAGQHFPLHALVDAEVNLPHPRIKGIHMSRLYLLLHAYADAQQLTPLSLTTLLHEMVDSHADCHSTQARLHWSFSLLLKRAALVTPQLSGWRSYPVNLRARLIAGVFSLEATVSVMYSSTCPCSAALSRQLVRERFEADFAGVDLVGSAQVAQWLTDYASVATPHSQRSVAEVTVMIAPTEADLGLLRLLDLIESVLQTPVQTAVKRIDEQAFARLNGSNLMYVEDAARKLQAALSSDYQGSRVAVRHLESLHPHDAVAQASEFSENVARTNVELVRGSAWLSGGAK